MLEPLEKPGSRGNGHYRHGPPVEAGVLGRQLDDPPKELAVDPARLKGCLGFAVDVLDRDVLMRRLVNVRGVGVGEAEHGVAWICGYVGP